MDFLQYELHVAVLIAVFYMFYRLLLSRDRLHALNRAVLMATSVASFVLPLCVITFHRTVTVAPRPAAVDIGAPLAAEAATAPWWPVLLLAVYWAGVAAMLVYTILSISKVCILIGRCERHRLADGTIVAVADGEVSPFSWMRYIVVPRSDYAHPDKAILVHEREHVRRRHSWDVLLVDLLSSLQWFNPAMWMLRADLRAIHEYEADAAVLSSGVDARQYQYLLLRKALAAGGYSVANGFNHSTLKQRITMMNVKKQNRYAWLKALYVLPVVAASLAVSARTVTDYKLAPAPAAKAEARTMPARTKGNAPLPAQTKAPEAAVPADTIQAEKPLTIVDGVEKTYAELQDMNPSDIESITVLKDKEAKEKYGDKGRHGVIVVTTKKAAATSGQSDGDAKVFEVVEVMPTFPGGQAALMQYLNSNVRYPKIAMERSVQGRVIVSFVINQDGSVSDVRIAKNGTKMEKPASMKGAGKDKKDGQKAYVPTRQEVEEAREALAAESKRVVEAMPDWQPGKQKGQVVRVKFNIPLTFRLN